MDKLGKLAFVLSLTIVFLFLDVPGKPGKPELVDSDKDHIKIKWSAPISNGGSPIIGYDVERRDRATGRWVKLNKEPMRHLEYYDDRVQEGHQYEYRVAAVNAAGPGKKSDTSNVFIAKPMKGERVFFVSHHIYIYFCFQKNRNCGSMELLDARLKSALENLLILIFLLLALQLPRSNGWRKELSFRKQTEFM